MNHILVSVGITLLACCRPSLASNSSISTFLGSACFMSNFNVFLLSCTRHVSKRQSAVCRYFTGQFVSPALDQVVSKDALMRRGTRNASPLEFRVYLWCSALQ